MDSLERVQQRATRVVKGLEHLSCEESLQDLGPFSLEQKWLRGDPIIYIYMYINTRREGAWRMEPDSSQRYSVTKPGQWTHTETLEAPSEHQDFFFFHCDSD